MPFTIEEAKLKKLLKSAVAEVLQEQRDLVRQAVIEAVEELGLVRAIEEGAGSKSVSRDQIFRLLRKRR
jgi:hypothetical protein